jgi:glucose-1-phosphate thymidylyltransferase
MSEPHTSIGEYAGVILAGGRGSRMAPFSDQWPKPLLPVVQKPVIAHQLAEMAALGIRDVYVVVSHLGQRVADMVTAMAPEGLRVECVDQGEPLGIAHAMGSVEIHLNRPFLVFLGDVFFVPRDLKSLFRTHQEAEHAAVLTVRRETDRESMRRNFEVCLGPDGRVERVVEKPREPTGDLKGCGVYLFTPDIFDVIRRTPRTLLRDEYELTEAIQLLIDSGKSVGVAEALEMDINLTVPRDLLHCNLYELQRRQLSRWVGDGAALHPEARVDLSVLGRDVKVTGPHRVARSLVFAGSIVRNDLEDAILTPHGMVVV